MDRPAVIVIGAGPAGIRAAARLVQAGLRPVLIEEGGREGGQIYRRQPANFTRPPAALYGADAGRATRLHGDFAALRAQIDWRPETLAWGVTEDGLMLLREGRAEALPWQAMILATGATERVMPVPGWTLPGVYGLGGAQIALKAQAALIGQRPVFLGTGPLLYLVAWQYAKAGADVQAVLDTSPWHLRLRAAPWLAARPGMLARGLRYTADLRRRGVRLAGGVTPLGIEGEGQVAALRWRDAAGREQRTECDAIGLGHGLRSETQLADLLQCDFAFDPVARQWLPVRDADGRSTRTGVYLAGDGALARGADAAEAAGQLAACAALRDLGHPVDELEMTTLRGRLRPMGRFRRGIETAFPWPARLAAGLPDETVICRCESITAGDIRASARALDAPEVNRAKAFIRAGMGRCQGRVCGLAAAEVLAAARGVPVEQVGRLRGAAPVKPLPAATEFAE
ncbi:NAD(P)/FAD-dependent oxidoreductase [Belnapia sp. T6]|uniref:NAD(P)/FAD-dependent oxidoreductase n=1 Tax=Belnapia mucosa TaxID=2804532 RepID=A0ABS1V626_9PROT|nr:FAD/NAD(P)-binding oxidoreductase [Belnapia mucosa]MBL6457111.1 NAD(P)/FAD-dependent oxidoreductase [Belnapia mucosa]